MPVCKLDLLLPLPMLCASHYTLFGHGAAVPWRAAVGSDDEADEGEDDEMQDDEEDDPYQLPVAHEVGRDSAWGFPSFLNVSAGVHDSCHCGCRQRAIRSI